MRSSYTVVTCQREVNLALSPDPFAMQVCKTREGRVMTLEELFRSMNLTAYDLTVDMLDVHAVRSGMMLSVPRIQSIVCMCPVMFQPY